MSEINNNIKLAKKQYHHLTYEDRIKIETLYNLVDENGKKVYSVTKIAFELGVNKSTISRELRFRIKSKINIRTGKIKNKAYNAIDAHGDYLYKRAFSKANYKLENYPDMKKFIEDRIKLDKWAPDAIVGYMENHNYFAKSGYCKISTPTIYNAIRLNILNVEIKDMRRMKYNKKYEYKQKKEVSESKKEYSIDNRPEYINNRQIFGHFELDTVIGKRNGVNECLMTLTERKTRYEIIFKISSKSAQAVEDKFNEIKDFMKINYNKVFKSITTDNGSEFSCFKEIITGTKTEIYFCHPYCSGEKGTNEKHNSMIRYFIPKGENINDYCFEEINDIAKWMNNYPRKILNYKTPLEALLEEFEDKAVINKIYKLQEKVNC